MVIKYDKTEYSAITHEIDIPDTKNVFLQGINPYDCLNTYFGIWTKKDSLIITTITSWRNVSYACYMNKNVCTESDIRKYLEFNKNVKIISKDEFKKQLDHVRSILEI